MVEVGAFVYGVTHISLYTADQMFDLVKVASEIVQRVYLTIGFTALIGLTTLAATSTDAMVRRLGALRWQRLHYAVYGIGALALIHYFQQTKADVSVPTFTAGRERCGAGQGSRRGACTRTRAGIGELGRISKGLRLVGWAKAHRAERGFSAR